MISELWDDIASKDITDIYEIIDDFKEKESSINLSLEEKIKYSFALMRADYLDSAMFQLEMLYKYIKDVGVNNVFMEKHPDFRNFLLSSFNVWEDCSGNIHVEPVDDCCCDGCEGCCGPCAAFICCAMPLAASDVFCGTNCCDSCESSVDPEFGTCCNCHEGGLCGSLCYAPCNCCDDLCCNDNCC